MARKNKRKTTQGSAIDTVRFGKALPHNLVHQCIKNIQQDRMSQLDKRSSTEQRMTKYLSQAQGLAKSGTDSASVCRAQDSLLKDHEKLAKKKLAVPKVLGGVGGLLPYNTIRATVFPPFDYDVIVPSMLAGNALTLEATSEKNTGEMSLNAITATESGFNGGGMYTSVGIYFHPPGRGTLTLSAAPTYSFQWWTNSLSSTDIVRSFGQLGLTVYGVDVAGQTTGETGTIVSTAGNEFFSWDESQSDQIQLDFGFDVQTATLSTELEVNRSLVYLLFVDAFVHVEGMGWPGSVAGAKLSVSVPYLTYDFRAEQVFSSF